MPPTPLPKPAPRGWHDLGTRSWILLSAGASAVGWILSALRSLDRVGYGVSCAAAVLLLACFAVRQRNSLLPSAGARPGRSFGRRVLHTFRRPLPALFLVIFLLETLGGALHDPSNIEGVGYRVPRVIHWLQEGGWHWIHTNCKGMNNRAVGIEWLSAPIILFTGSPRFLFLINAAAFALLPGLVFKVFRQCGVRARMAALWMWVLPAGFCYTIQAGSIGNDAYATVYVLAAIYFARRFRDYGAAMDFHFSILAAALFTGNKITNLPLLLPWVLAFLPPRLPSFSWRASVATAGTVTIAFLASCLPIAIANHVHLGDWTGLSDGELKAPGPLAGAVGSAFQLACQNVMPPIFWWSDRWNSWMNAFLASGWGVPFRHFESFGALTRAVRDETAALGPGVVLLLGAALLPRRDAPRCPGRTWIDRLFLCSPWISLLALLASSGVREIGRMAAPYYPMLVASLLATPRTLTRLSPRTLRRLAVAVMLLTLVTVLISRSRPLIPAEWLLRPLRDRFPQNVVIASAYASFSAHRETRDCIRQLLSDLPAEERELGMITSTARPEFDVSRPMGRYRVRYLAVGDTPDYFRAQNVRFIIVEERVLPDFPYRTIEDLLRTFHASLRREVACPFDPAAPPVVFYLVELNAAPTPR